MSLNKKNMNWKVFGRMVAVSFLAIAAVAVVVGVFSRNRKGWTEWEQKVISLSDSLMYVTVLPEDSLILRTPSADLSESMLRSPQLKILLDKMLYTVQDPSQDGVGIAAPQVGINRRIVCVQRFDKPGEPFECYLNVRAELLAPATRRGQEGCLSVPGYRGSVLRSEKVAVHYIKPGTLESKVDTVEGFTAVIFQHECDHLDGILYIDRADSLSLNPDWIAGRTAFSYIRPAWWQNPAKN